MNRHPPQQKGGPLVGLDQGFRPNPAKQALIPRRFCRSTSVPQVNARRDSPTSSGMRIPLPITLDSTAAATQNGQSRAETSNRVLPRRAKRRYEVSAGIYGASEHRGHRQIHSGRDWPLRKALALNMPPLIEELRRQGV